MTNTRKQLGIEMTPEQEQELMNRGYSWSAVAMGENGDAELDFNDSRDGEDDD